VDAFYDEQLADICRRWQQIMPASAHLPELPMMVTLQAVQRLLLPTITAGYFPPKRYGLCFCNRSEATAPCHSVLREAAMHATGEKGQRVVQYYARTDADGMLHCPPLQSDLDNNLLDGLILLCVPPGLPTQPLLAGNSVPRLCVGVAGQVSLPHLPFLCLDKALFVQRAIAWLQSQHCRRIVAISNAQADSAPWLQYLQPAVATAGMQLAEPPLLTLPLDSDLQDLIDSLFSHGQTVDAMVLCDDGLMGRIASALLLAGIAVPQQLQVVSRCCFPMHEYPLLPLTFLGLPAELLLATAMTVLDRIAAGNKPPAQLMLPVLFASEWQVVLDAQAALRRRSMV